MMNGILICLSCDDMKWEIYLHIEAIKKKCSAVWRLWVIDVKSVHYCTERPTWLHIKKKIKPCVSQKALNPTLLVFLFQHKLNERNLAPLVTIDLWTLFMSNLTYEMPSSILLLNKHSWYGVVFKVCQGDGRLVLYPHEQPTLSTAVSECDCS